MKTLRFTTTALGLAALGIASLVIADACVPADTRPPPAELNVTVSPSPIYQHGVTTTDGWDITFDRTVLALGNESFSDSCTAYGEAGYDRIVDLAAGPGQKVGILHGIGKCDLRFRIGPPSTEVVLGATVTDAERDQMLIPFTDPYLVESGNTNGSGTAIDIALHAEKAGVTKTFHLLYRRRIRYQNCTTDAPPADASTAMLQQTDSFSDAGDAVDLASNGSVVFDLLIEPEAVLRDDPNPSAAVLRFDGFASADTDGDGVITLDELRAVPIQTIRDAGPFEASTYDIDDAGLLQRGKPVVIATLGDYLYELLVPTLLRFRGSGWCEYSSQGRRPN